MDCLYSCSILILLIQLLANVSEANLTRQRIFKRSRSVTRTNTKSKDTSILSRTSRSTYFKPNISDECKRIGICENMRDYPESQVQKLVKELLEKEKVKFNVDEIEFQIAERFGSLEKNLPLCDANERLLNPQAAKDMDDKWYFIINNVLGATQSFRVDICKTAEGSCNSVAIFAQGNKARCVQKYILRRMMAIDYDGKVIEKHFQIPSCCSCVYEVL